MGIPSDREQYIHRLGRTGREGKDGEGMLVLAPWEEYFLDEIKDLPIEKSSFPRLDPDVKVKVCPSYFALAEFQFMAGSRSLSVKVMVSLYWKYKIDGACFWSGRLIVS